MLFFFSLLLFILYFYTPLHTMSGAFVYPSHFHFVSPIPYVPPPV